MKYESRIKKKADDKRRSFKIKRDDVKELLYMPSLIQTIFKITPTITHSHSALQFKPVDLIFKQMFDRKST